MPLPVPNLDDRTFDQLAAEARALIPRYFPPWTDYNASDPGITLLDLFAFLHEAAHYQIDRVPQRTLQKFAGLVGVQPDAGESIEELLRRALDKLQANPRAVTPEEMEQAALQVEGVARARCQLEVVSALNVFPSEQFVTVIVVPQSIDPAPAPSPELRQKVYDMLHERSLITTRLRVTAPGYQPVSLSLTVVRDPLGRSTRQQIEEAVREAIVTFLSPLTGGPQGTGWEFGRSLFRSELYQVVEAVPEVDHVQELTIVRGSLFANGDLRDAVSLSARLLRGADSQSQDVVAPDLWHRFDPQMRERLSQAGRTTLPTAELTAAVRDTLNQLVNGPALLNASWFPDMIRSAETMALQQQLSGLQQQFSALPQLPALQQQLSALQPLPALQSQTSLLQQQLSALQALPASQQQLAAEQQLQSALQQLQLNLEQQLALILPSLVLLQSATALTQSLSTELGQTQASPQLMLWERWAWQMAVPLQMQLPALQQQLTLLGQQLPVLLQQLTALQQFPNLQQQLTALQSQFPSLLSPAQLTALQQLPALLQQATTLLSQLPAAQQILTGANQGPPVLLQSASLQQLQAALMPLTTSLPGYVSQLQQQQAALAGGQSALRQQSAQLLGLVLQQMSALQQQLASLQQQLTALQQEVPTLQAPPAFQQALSALAPLLSDLVPRLSALGKAADDNVRRLNRSIIEDLFPREIAGNSWEAELPLASSTSLIGIAQLTVVCVDA